VTESAYTTLVDLAAGGMLLATVLIVWRRDLAAMVRLLAAQGLALGAVPVLSGIRRSDAPLIAVGAVVIILRAVVFPRLIGARLHGEAGEDREARPLVNTTASLLVTAALTIVAYVVARPLVNLDPSPATRAAPVGFAIVLIGVFLLISRRKALSQIIAFLVLDNGIDAVAFLATLGVPVIVELGASLDVLLALVILGVLTGRMQARFGGTDLDDLRELRE
jgi:hydrogenase-4 component E